MVLVETVFSHCWFTQSSEFITVLTTARHFYLPWARQIQSKPSQSISLKSILTLSSHLCLSLPIRHYGYRPNCFKHLPSAPHLPHSLPFPFTFISVLHEYMARNINCKSSCYAVSISYSFYYPSDPRIFLRVVFLKTLSLGSSLNMKQQNVWGHQKLSEYDLKTHRF
jgi:hypothetical protein